MNTDIQVFNSPQFGEVRTLTGASSEPLFCLADVCEALGLTTTKVAQRLEDGVLSKHPITDSLGREQQALFVNEDGLYDVIFDSRKPAAKKFRKWVTSEVLPSIRKTGSYNVKGEPYADAVKSRECTYMDEVFLKAVAEAIYIQDAALAKLRERVESLEQAQSGQPRNTATKLFSKAKEPHKLASTTEVASRLGMRAVELNNKLSELGIICRIGKGRKSVWLPREPYSTWGLAAEFTKPLTRDDGTQAELTYYPWTQRGQKFIQFLAENGWIVEPAIAYLREYEKTNA